ncbi:MAG: hypothetical protein ACPG4U_15800, partial [Pseudomonadales bacterium]
DPKALKQAAAIARTKLKKLQSQRAKLEDSDPECAALDSQISAMQEKVASTAQALEAGAQQSPAPDPAERQALQEDCDKALKTLDKARSALSKAETDNSPALEKMRAGTAKLEAKYATAVAALQAYDAQGSAAPENTALQEDCDKALKTLEKARAALTKAEADNSPALEKMRAGAAKLEAKYEAAKAALQAHSAQSTSTPDNSALREACEKALKTLEKARAAVTKAEADNSPALEKMRAGAAKLEEKYEAAKAAFDASQNNSPTPVPAQQPPAPLDLKALKQAVSIARTKLKKAQQSDDAAEIARLEQMHSEALQALDAAEAPLLARAAEHGVDLAQLRKDCALASASVKKAEKSLLAASDETRQALQDALNQHRQQADALAQTLRSIEHN